MRRFALVPLVLLTACARPSPILPRAEVPDPPTQRLIGVYAAVIRQLVTTEDSTFGEDPDFPVIHVVDHPEESADDPMATEPSRGEPFSAEVRDGILRELSDLPIGFVADGGEVVIPVEEGGGVEGDGVVVTLGPIPEGGAKVEVAASLYAGPLAATWLKYVVEDGADGWEVTGTTGPVAIS